LKRVTGSLPAAESSTLPLPDAVLVRRLNGRNVSKADVLVCRMNGRTIALKDYGSRPLLVRQTVGRLFVRRECRAYAAARGCAGLPPFLGRVGPFALATEWLDAVPLAECPRAGDEIFDRLDVTLADLHARGVALADLHHRDVLVAADGAVRVVDLAAAFVLSPRAGRFRRALFARARGQDRLAAARMRARFTGRSEREALAGLDRGTVRLWGIGRRIKALWNRLRGRSS
jgi:hypothetical protein